MKKIDYFYDGNRYVAAIDKGEGGFFIRRGESEAEDTWTFVIPGSILWDGLHQDIYYASHDLDPCPPEIVKRLPPLPEPPAFTPLKWEDNFKHIESMPAEELPAIAARLYASGSGCHRFWFLLHEATPLRHLKIMK